MQPLGADRRGRVGEGQADDSERAAASIIGSQLDRGERLLVGSGERDQLVVALDGRIQPAALLLLPPMTMSSVLASSATTLR